MEMTKKELAELTGLTYRQVHNIDQKMQQQGQTLFEKGEEGKYKIGVFVQRWVDWRVQESTADMQDLDQIKARHEAVKMEKTQLEVDQMNGSLVDVQDVRRLWGDIANTVMTNMIHLPSVLAPMLRGLTDQAVIESLIDTEIRKTLEALADTPLPAYILLKDDVEE